MRSWLPGGVDVGGHRLHRDHTEWKELEEQVDQLTSYQQAHALLGKEPAIPVTYLLATPSGWSGPPAYEAVILDYIARYVDRFSPGSSSRSNPPTTWRPRCPTASPRSWRGIIADP